MGLHILAGPAGSGKTQTLDRVMGRSEVLIDFTSLFSAIAPRSRGRERVGYDPRIPLAMYLYTVAIRQARQRELDGWVTTATGARANLNRLQELAGAERVFVIDPGPKVILEQLGQRNDTRARGGGASEACFSAVENWYGDALSEVDDLAALVDFDLSERTVRNAVGYVPELTDVDLLDGRKLSGTAATVAASAAITREVYDVEEGVAV